MRETTEDKLKYLSYLVQLTTFAVTMKNDKLKDKLTNKITALAEEELKGISDLKVL